MVAVAKSMVLLLSALLLATTVAAQNTRTQEEVCALPFLNCANQTACGLQGCSACPTGTFFATRDNINYCAQCDANCAAGGCTNYQGCTQCNSGYFKDYSNGVLVCKQCDANCRQCVDYVGCNECAPNFIFIQKNKNSSERSCERCSGCGADACEDFFGCTFCAETNNGTITSYLGVYQEGTPTPCLDCDENCEPNFCFDSVGCERCNSGFFTFTNNATAIGTSCINCSTNNCPSGQCVDEIGCTGCAAGFTLVETTDRGVVCERGATLQSS